MAPFHEEVFDAISRRNSARVKAYINNGGELNNCKYKKMTLLHFAIQNYDHLRDDRIMDDIIECLIDNGAMVNAINVVNGMNATMFAMTRKVNDEPVIKLIKAGADLNYAVPKSQEKTTLAYAMENGYGINVISELLDKGANPDCRLERQTPLFHAVHNRNDPELVALFLNAGANTELLLPYYCPFIAKCCQTSCKIDEVCRYKKVIDIIKKGGYNLKGEISEIGDTLIHVTTCTYLIYLAVKDGVSIDVQNKLEYTPLQVALDTGNKEKVNNLLLMGADPNCESLEWLRPLRWPWVYRDAILSTILLFHGANLLATNLYNETPIDCISNQSYNPRSGVSELALKMIIKHFMLYHNEYSLDKIRNFTFQDSKEYFLQFTAACRGELSVMRNSLLIGDLSIYSFLHKRKYYRTEVVPIKIQELTADYKSILTVFPIYKDLIFMRLKDNFRKDMRHKLINIIHRRSIVVGIAKENPKDEVFLNHHCLRITTIYLSFRQLYALFLASLNNH